MTTQTADTNAPRSVTGLALPYTIINGDYQSSEVTKMVMQAKIAEQAAEIERLLQVLQKIADLNFDALKGQQKDYYVALKEGMSAALAAL